MKTSAFLVICGLFTLTNLVTSQTAMAAEKIAMTVSGSYTFFALPFTLTPNKSQIVVPKTAARDTATSSSVGFTLKTPEGLRQTGGQAVGMVVKDARTDEYVLYVLYKDTVPSARVSTLAITHLPFLLVNAKTGTSSQQLNPSELRNFVVKNPNVKKLTDSE
ncbi:MAG: hypothetical protein ACK4SL_02010 [Candidatus Paceibacteria bacterium]